MLNKLRERRDNESGFTLIELLVVILIIGILAAIALPAFLGQQTKGQDASAKSDARNAVTQMESCFQDSGQTYVGCAGPTNAPASGQTKTDYVVTATSKSGNTFIITKTGTGATRSCTVPSGNERGGCGTGDSW